MTSIRQLQYQPLRDGQIRVLCLQPGSFGSPLEASLDIVELDHAESVQPDLEALDFRLPGGADDARPMPNAWRKNLKPHTEMYKSIFDAYYKTRSAKNDLSIAVNCKATLAQELRTGFRQSNASGEDSYLGQALTSDAELTIKDTTDIGKLTRNWADTCEQSFGAPQSLSLDTYSDLVSCAIITLAEAQFHRDSLVLSACSDGTYEALSYAWGVPVPTERIRLLPVDEDHEVYVAITNSLYEALQYLRHHDSIRRLWVDAICIDASNVAERSQQISIMSRIYSAAARVVVWLGPPDSDTCSAFGCLNANLLTKGFNLKMPKGHTDYLSKKGYVFRRQAEYMLCGCPSSCIQTSDDGKAAMELLGSRAWFTRLWTCQELASAKYSEFHCGSHRLPWAALARTSPKRCRIRQISWHYDIARQVREVSHSPCILIWFLVQTSPKQCQHAQDRLLAIQSITGLSSAHVPALRRNATATELFIQLTEYCLTARREDSAWSDKEMPFVVPHVALLLTLAPLTSMPDSGLPSWVPDIDNLPRNAHELLGEYSHQLADSYRFGSPYITQSKTSGTCTSCVNRMNCQMRQANRCLSIQSCHFATVAEIAQDSQVPEQDTGDVEAMLSSRAALNAWFRICRDFAAKYWNSSNFEVKLKELLGKVSQIKGSGKYMRTILGARALALEDAGMPWPSSREEMYNVCRVDLEDDLGVKDPAKLEDWILELPVIVSYNIFSGHRNRKLSALRETSGKVYIGWIPPSAKVGDPIYLFVGVPRPFLIIPHEEDRTSFQVVGDCWIHEMCELDIDHYCEQHETDLEWINLR